MRSAIFFVACGLILTGCAGSLREVSGTLVRSSARAPAAGQPLALDRPPGDYGDIPFAMLIFGVPQPTTIATATTDARGRFRFVTRKDRGRFLSVHLASVPASAGAALPRHDVESLRDSLHPARVSYDDYLFYDADRHWHLRPRS